MKNPIIISKYTNLLVYSHQIIIKNLKKEYSFKNDELDNIDVLFYGKNKKVILSQIEYVYGKEVTKFIEEVASLQEKYFKKINLNKDLINWERFYFKNRKIFNKVFLICKNLCSVKGNQLKIPVYLVSKFNKSEKSISAWYSWTSQESFIVIEIPLGYKPELFDLSVLLHEYFHLMIRKNKKLLNLISKVAQDNNKILNKLKIKNISNIQIFEELLVSSFLPEGYLGQKYFKNQITGVKRNTRTLLDWRRYVGNNMIHFAQEYLNNKKNININYLNKIINLIKK